MLHKHRPYTDWRDDLRVAADRGTLTHAMLDTAASELASADPTNRDPYAVVLAATDDYEVIEAAETKARDDWDNNDSALCHIDNVAWCILYHQYYTRLETDIGLRR